MKITVFDFRDMEKLLNRRGYVVAVEVIRSLDR